jgi:hypothetical protein
VDALGRQRERTQGLPVMQPGRRTIGSLIGMRGRALGDRQWGSPPPPGTAGTLQSPKQAASSTRGGSGSSPAARPWPCRPRLHAGGWWCWCWWCWCFSFLVSTGPRPRRRPGQGEGCSKQDIQSRYCLETASTAYLYHILLDI